MAVELAAPASCASCGLHQCHHNVEKAFTRIAMDRQAWLLDEKWPEFNDYLLGRGDADPLVLLPWSSKLVRQENYAWKLPECARTNAAPFLTLQRSRAMRGLKPQGARRQQVLEGFDRRFAAAYARRVPYNVTRLVVWQNFLPFLHMDKTLGGREYEALVWRAPRHVLHEKLTEAQRHYPESPTLRDFRSSPLVLEAERRAFEGAEKIITPHRQLAELYPDKTQLLEWVWPKSPGAKAGGRKIGFLGPTVGRRGAYVVREAMKKLKHPLVTIGKNLEDEKFWDGMKIDSRLFSPQWVDDIGLLLAPVVTEYKPRLLMQALQRGVTVIATVACGLPPAENLHLVDPYDADALAGKIEELRPR